MRLVKWKDGTRWVCERHAGICAAMLLLLLLEGAFIFLFCFMFLF
jgi:hypothetical protein